MKIKSLGQIEDILKKYQALDVPKAHAAAFLDALVNRRDAWFVEAGDAGLIWFTSVLPRYHAEFNFAFWDGKIPKARREILKTVVGTAFDRFELPRITAFLPASNNAAKTTLTRCGFTIEGAMRQMWPSDPPEDTIILGMLRSEIPWPLLKMTSLD